VYFTACKLSFINNLTKKSKYILNGRIGDNDMLIVVSVSEGYNIALFSVDFKHLSMLPIV
jgi:hypothetical protein